MKQKMSNHIIKEPRIESLRGRLVNKKVSPFALTH
jgi:hypothetical protein